MQEDHVEFLREEAWCADNDNMPILAGKYRKVAAELERLRAAEKTVQEEPTNEQLDCLKQFEKWITSPPYEHTLKKWPNDCEKYAWPGQYVNVNTQLAWEAWEEAWKSCV